MSDLEIVPTDDKTLIIKYKNKSFESIKLDLLTDDTIEFVTNFMLLITSLSIISNNPFDTIEMTKTPRGRIFITSFCIYFMENKSKFEQFLNTIKNADELMLISINLFLSIMTAIQMKKENLNKISQRIDTIINHAMADKKSMCNLLCAKPLNKEDI